MGDFMELRLERNGVFVVHLQVKDIAHIIIDCKLYSTERTGYLEYLKTTKNIGAPRSNYVSFLNGMNLHITNKTTVFISKGHFEEDRLFRSDWG